MVLRLFSPPSISRIIFNSITWDKPTDAVIYLTFDDGPDQDISPWLMEFLEHHSIQATFFLSGASMKANHGLCNTLKYTPHSIGNHGFRHISGWFTSNKKYLENVFDWEAQYREVFDARPRKLFRPPYGQITPGQVNKIRATGYEIIMWSLLSYDFDKKLPAEEIINMLCKTAAPGSIIVFHENAESREKLKKILPPFVEYCNKQGYGFERL